MAGEAQLEAIVRWLLTCPAFSTPDSAKLYTFFSIATVGDFLLSVKENTIVQDVIGQKYGTMLLSLNSSRIVTGVPASTDLMNADAIRDIAGLAKVQAVGAWVAEQNAARNYPFPGCTSVIPTADLPAVSGVDTEKKQATFTLFLKITYEE